MTKSDALQILNELGNSKNMANHGKAAGFSMASLYDYFKLKGQKVELTKGEWEIVGLLHDADYEKTNKSLELHTEETTKLLSQINADQIIINAIRGHCDKSSRDTLLAKSIYAVDELTGLIVACALVQLDKKLKSVTIESVLRKFKDKSFAAGANRDQIKTCETELDIPLEEFMALTLAAMQNQAGELGL